MSRPEREVDVERLRTRLVDIDEALAHGDQVSERRSPAAAGDEQLVADLHEAKDCLLRLETIWPRGAPKTGSSADGLSPLGSGWPSLHEFLQSAVNSGLLSPEETHDFMDSLSPDERPEKPDDLARFLVDRRLLTYYQLSALAAAKADELVLGNYVVLEKLGQGGMGTVFKARHRAMNRIVALKVPPPAVMRSSAVVERFKREIQAAAKLSHPNIVAAYDAGSANGVHFLAMEYVEGIDLAQYVRRQGPLSVPGAVDFTLQTARALEYAHGHGVIHRDVKPANLLLDGEATVRILDMGLARIQGELTSKIERKPPPADCASDLTTGGLMGTVDYMAPEQALDPRNASRKSDMYSLGCTLHFLLTGYPVYAGDTNAEKLAAHREAAVVSLREVRPDVPPRLETIFRRMVAKRPQQRYDSMRDVVRDLEACLLEFEPRGEARWPSRFASRRTAAALLAVAGALLLFLFAGELLRPSPRVGSPNGAGRASDASSPQATAAGEQISIPSPNSEAITKAIRLAASSRQTGDVSTAKPHLREAGDLLKPIEAYADKDRPLVTTHLVELGQEYLALENFAAAETCLNEAAGWLQSQTVLVARDQNVKRTLARALALLRDLHYKAGDWQQASRSQEHSHRHWFELYERDKSDASIHRELARSYYARGELSLQMSDTVAAENSFELALQVERTNAMARQALYDLLSRITSEKYQSGDYAGAWAPSRRAHTLLEEMVAAEPDDGNLRARLGTSFFYLGDIRKNLNDLEGAAQHFEKSLEFDPGGGQALRGLAECFNRLGDRRRNSRDLSGAMQYYQRANEILSKLVEERPNSARDKRTLADSFDRLGSTANALGESAKGREYFEKRDTLLEFLEAPPATEEAKGP